MRTFFLIRNIKLTTLLKVLLTKVNKVITNGNKWNCIATQSLLVNLWVEERVLKKDTLLLFYQ